MHEPIDENTLAYRLKKTGFKRSVQLERATEQLAERVHPGYEQPQTNGRQRVFRRRLYAGQQAGRLWLLGQGKAEEPKAAAGPSRLAVGSREAAHVSRVGS